MKITKEKQDDGRILVTFEHNGVTDTRVIDPILDKKGKIDKALTDERISEIAAAIEAKIEVGHVTNDSILMMKATPVVVTTGQRAIPIEEPTDT